jgi:hypothetical protein
MKYAVEMRSGGVMLVASSIKFARGIQKLTERNARHADSMVIAYAYFYCLNTVSRLK